jgi:hypothetical protein
MMMERETRRSEFGRSWDVRGILESSFKVTSRGASRDSGNHYAREGNQTLNRGRVLVNR